MQGLRVWIQRTGFGFKSARFGRLGWEGVARSRKLVGTMLLKLEDRENHGELTLCCHAALLKFIVPLK